MTEIQEQIRGFEQEKALPAVMTPNKGQNSGGEDLSKTRYIVFVVQKGAIQQSTLTHSNEREQLEVDKTTTQAEFLKYSAQFGTDLDWLPTFLKDVTWWANE